MKKGARDEWNCALKNERSRITIEREYAINRPTRLIPHHLQTFRVVSTRRGLRLGSRGLYRMPTTM